MSHPGTSAGPYRPLESSWRVLRGPVDDPCDGIQDYLENLDRTLREQGRSLEIHVLDWKREPLLRFLRRIWREAGEIGKKPCLLQFTSSMWGPYALPVFFVATLILLKIRGVSPVVQFQDVIPYPGGGGWAALRRFFQLLTFRVGFRGSDRSTFTISPSLISWLGARVRDRRVWFLPVGSNVHDDSPPEPMELSSAPGKMILVFGVTEGARAAEEVAAIAYVARRCAENLGEIGLHVFGRGAMEVEGLLRSSLIGARVLLTVSGILPAMEVRRRFREASVQVSVRGVVRSQNTCVIAGIASGIPIVGYRGQQTGSPLEEAGILLVPERDREAMAATVERVLRENPMAEELRRRNQTAYRRYFSWEVIARGMIDFMEEG